MTLRSNTFVTRCAMAALVALCQGGPLLAQQRMPIGPPAQTVEPPLADDEDLIRSELARFRPWNMVSTTFAYWAGYHANWAEARACLYTDRPSWAQYVKHARWRADCWNELNAAQNSWASADYKRQCLTNLSANLGAFLYERGRMPLPVPWMDFLFFWEMFQ